MSIDKLYLGPMTPGEWQELLQTLGNKHRAEHGCLDVPMTALNRERSGNRPPTNVSRWIRAVTGVRSIDLDQVMFCGDKKCSRPILFIEVKPANLGIGCWAYCRELADETGSFAMLCVEPPGVTDRFTHVLIYPASRL